MMKVVLLVSVGAVAASCLASAATNLPPLRADRWVNSPPLSAEALHGKVVLVDFWEYTCVNWIRTSPYVKAWNSLYAPFGLVVVGVHAPEFEFGKAVDNIDRGIRDHELTYPIAIDISSPSGARSETTRGQRNTSSTIGDAWCGAGLAKGATTKSSARSAAC